MWETDYYTDYETYTSSIAGTTVWSTYTYTSYKTISTEADTSTEWVTVTSTAAQAGKRGIQPTAKHHAPCHSMPLPSSTISMATATPAAEQQEHQEVLKPDVTDPPRYIQIRGLLFPRQTMRTDTSSTTEYRTTYITTTIETTVYRTSTEYSTDWTTTTATRTAALNAKTTVTSTTTLTLRPGETIPSSPEETDFELSGGGGGSSGRRKGLASAARAGIGVGVSLGVAFVAAGLGFLIRRHKAKKAEAAGAVVGAAGAVGPQGGEFKGATVNTVGAPGPMSPPPPSSAPRYSQMTQTPPVQYGTPSPAPVYGYPQQAMGATPMAMGSPPPPQIQQHNSMGRAQMPMGGSPHMMGGSPPPQQMYGQPQQGHYQYPRPPSPVLNNGGQGNPIGVGMGGMQQPMPMQPGMQGGRYPPSEMPAVYSPQPQRPG